MAYTEAPGEQQKEAEERTMAKFGTAPIQDVVPKRQQRQPSQRAQVQAQYQQALQEAIDNQLALVVELEDDDKPLTIRNRLKRAADTLGIEHLMIRRRKNRIIAFQPQAEEQLELPEPGSVGLQ
jgi:hypothetical protein